MFFKHKVVVRPPWKEAWLSWLTFHLGTQVNYRGNREGVWAYYKSTEQFTGAKIYEFRFKHKSDAILFQEYGVEMIKVGKNAREVAKEYFSGLPYYPTEESKMMFKLAAG